MANNNPGRVALNQIIAVEPGAKKRLEESVTELYKSVQKAAAFGGMTRTYQPFNDEDPEKLPAEEKLCEQRVWDVSDKFSDLMRNILNISLTKESGNCDPNARADVVVDGVVLVENAPVTFLMALEKKLVDIRTFINHLPTLSPGMVWEWDNVSNSYVTPENIKYRTRKTVSFVIAAEATEHHPAQVKEVSRDESIGQFKEKYLSCAIPRNKKELALERVNKILDATKAAREKANSVTVEQKQVPDHMFNLIFDCLKPG